MVSAGWGISGIIRVRYDRVSRLVRLSLVFSVSVISLSILWMLVQPRIGSFLFENRIPFAVFLLFGAVLRFLPLSGKLIAGFLCVSGLILTNAVFSAPLPADTHSAFGTAVFLNENTLELTVRYNKGGLREESFFLKSREEGKNRDFGVKVMHPVPFLFQKHELYYIITLFPDNEDAVVKEFPQIGPFRKGALKVIDALGLARIEDHTLNIPVKILRLHFLEFDDNGKPFFIHEY